MPYDKSLEKVLAQKRVAHYDNKDWGATVISVVSYNEGKPKIQLSYWFKDQNSGEEKIVPFVSQIPPIPKTVQRIAKVMVEFADEFSIDKSGNNDG